jgi:hypothetical protein
MPNSLPTQPWTHKGVPIRCIAEDGSISISDIWKAEGQRASLRPDKWAKQKGNQQFLESFLEKTGNPGWIVLKGSLQGTFAAPEVVARYAQSISPECYDQLSEILDAPSQIGKAKRRTIHLGDKPLAVFQLPTGKYRLSQTQVAEAIVKDEANVRDFLASKSPEALPYKDFTAEKTLIEGERARFNAIPIDLAIAYWTKEARVDNQVAITLLSACAKETIERRADKAFGVQRTEEEYNQRFKNAFELLSDFFPEYTTVMADPPYGSQPMVLAEKEIFKKLKRKFPKEIFSFSKTAFIRDFLLLGAETDDWHLTYEKGLAYPEGAAYRNAYPDLMSQPFETLVDGVKRRIVLLFQGIDTIVDENDIKDCVYLRDYIDVTKDEFQADHVLLFFVAPYGVTRYAAACIKERSDLNSCVGVITVKQMAKFLFQKAAENKKDNNIRLGKLKGKFKHLMEYKDLDKLLEQEELNKLSIQPGITSPFQLTLELFAS